MASPSVVNTATSSGGPTTSPVVNLPGSIVSGNTLVIMIRAAEGGDIGWPAGYPELVDASADPANDQQAIAYRKADGLEPSTITLSTGGGKFAAIAYQIQDAADPTVTTPDISTVATGTSTTPDPTTVTPAGGEKDYLFLWMGGWEGKQTSPPAGNPTNYSNPIGASTGGAGAGTANCRVATAERALTAASEDPPSWAISPSDDWSAYALGVHPAAAAFSHEYIPQIKRVVRSRILTR